MSRIEVDGFNGLRGRLWRYGPLLTWSALIFLFSSSVMSASNTGSILRPILLGLFPHASDATIYFIHFGLRKAAHFTEYAILAWFAARALRTSSHEILRHRWFLISLLFVVIYSLTDEFHQSFVSTRTASIYDCMIDSAGGLTALVVLARRRRVRTPTRRGSARIKTPA